MCLPWKWNAGGPESRLRGFWSSEITSLVQRSRCTGEWVISRCCRLSTSPHLSRWTVSYVTFKQQKKYSFLVLNPETLIWLASSEQQTVLPSHGRHGRSHSCMFAFFCLKQAATVWKLPVHPATKFCYPIINTNIPYKDYLCISFPHHLPSKPRSSCLTLKCTELPKCSS